MRMYNKEEVKYIVEEFLADYFSFESVSLNSGSIVALRRICSGYGTEVENIVENED